MKNWHNIVIFSASIILVLIACVVQGEHKKRDVHRIIIQERIPKPRHLPSHDAHHHGKRSGQRNGKKGSKVDMSSEEFSKNYEDSGSFSLESHEKPEKFVSSKLKYFKNPLPYKTTHPSNKPNGAHKHSSVQHITYSDWIPLETDPVTQHSQVQSKHRKPNSFPNNNDPITTYSDSTNYPAIQYEPAAIYPIAFLPDGQNNYHNMQYFNNPNMKQNSIDLTQLSLISAIEPMEQINFDMMQEPKMKNNEDRLKNHRLTDYEVVEGDSSEAADDMMVSENKSVKNPKEKHHSKRERRNRSRGGSKENAKVYRHVRSRTNDKDRTHH